LHTSNHPIAGHGVKSPNVGMARLIRYQIENLLQIVELESSGATIQVDEFDLSGRLSEPSDRVQEKPGESRRAVKQESANVYRHIEPRLQMISNLLAHLSLCGRFKSHGNVVSFDGFRLKDLEFWSRYPSTRLIDNFGELSTWCNCDCEFCFLRGSRDLSPKRPMLSIREAKTRARYYSAERRIGLPTPSAPPGEPLANPRAITLLQIARNSHPDHVIDLTTNGDFLTEKMVDALAALKPIHISLSLNSSNVELRRQIMRSRRPNIAVNSVRLLQERGIQFTGSIVPSPSVPLDDIEETMRYLDRHGPLQIRLLLPGFTKHVPDSAKFDTGMFWDALVELASHMRGELRSPLLIQPGFYWNKNIQALIDGVFPNSPAHRAGLRFGDRIVRVNSQIVVTRAEAGFLLEQPPDKGKPWVVKLDIERQGLPLSVELSNEFHVSEDLYPYKPAGYAPSFEVLARWGFGVQLMDGFDIGWLKALKEIVERQASVQKILVFTTPLVKDLYVQAIQIAGDASECRLPDVEVRVTVARQNFWGGNIVIGDLHVVEDYVDHLRRLQRAGYRPDLAIIPSTFTNSWGLDLLGHSYLEIERRTGVKIELVMARRVMV
jgi:sulfatase maturation enzyme AslB (radical SAM superfamily)